MMLSDALGCLLPGINYKDGWTFRLESPIGNAWSDWWSMPDLVVEFPIADSRGRLSAKDLKLVMRFDVPTFEADSSAALEWFRSCLVRAETHEVDEWLTVGGRRPFDPHTHEGAARRGVVINQI